MSLHIGICTLNAMRTFPVVMDAIAQANLHDKLWVVDSGSTDGTIDFATASGATVMHRELGWLCGSTSISSRTLSQPRGDWALMLDADEWPDASLWKAIAKLLDTGPTNGFWRGVAPSTDLARQAPELCLSARTSAPAGPTRTILRSWARSGASRGNPRPHPNRGSNHPVGRTSSCMMRFSILKTHCPKILATPRYRGPFQSTNGGVGRLLFSPLAAFCKQFDLETRIPRWSKRILDEPNPGHGDVAKAPPCRGKKIA